MPESTGSPPTASPSAGQKTLAYGVHVLTALGAVCAFQTAAAILADHHVRAFLWMLAAVILDTVDGPIARRVDVRRVLPHFDGRRLDDIVDYLNYTFLPIVLIWHAGWLPQPAWLWSALPLLGSLFAFCNVGAKEEEEGFFVGFPSYWNVVAFYVAVLFHRHGPYVVLALIVALSVLSVLPVRFVYPNLAPRWKGLFIGGAALWAVLGLVILSRYPDVPAWMAWSSLSYPAFYVIASVYLDRMSRRKKGVRRS